ncbi:transposase-like zinc-binding domain-containing protein [Bifidobacterium criceti]
MCVWNPCRPLLPLGLTAVRKCRFHGVMGQPLCPRCGGEMKRNGTTSAGRTRWRCKDTGCGSSRTRGYDTAARDVRGFIDWLLSADTQERRHVSARTLRRRNELGWSLWPPCPMDGCILSSRCFGFGHVVFSVLVIGACWSWLIGCWCGRT